MLFARSFRRQSNSAEACGGANTGGEGFGPPQGAAKRFDLRNKLVSYKSRGRLLLFLSVVSDCDHHGAQPRSTTASRLLIFPRPSS